MSFTDDIKGFTVKLEAKNQELFANIVSATKESIVNGSPVTGSPGQPVDTANLRNSWTEGFESESVATISTNVEYAPYVEEGLAHGQPAHFQNHGPHSVEQTALGFDRLVVDEARKLEGGA